MLDKRTTVRMSELVHLTLDYNFFTHYVCSSPLNTVGTLSPPANEGFSLLFGGGLDAGAFPLAFQIENEVEVRVAL